MRPSGRAFIDGRAIAAHSGASFVDVSPIDGRRLAEVVCCETAEVDAAVAAARAAFERGDWAACAPAERKRVLLRFAQRVEDCSEELALLETLDVGKPIHDSLTIDVPATVRCLRWYAEAIDKIYDEIAPTGVAALALVRREPMGVVGAIVPWNFPMIMAAWKIAPALATGNSVLLKPSEKSPLSAIRLGELALEAGLPAGVLNVLPGDGRTGAALAAHMDIDAIAFTGSTTTGRAVMQSAASSNLKRVSLECGGKSPNVVLADCPDVAQAARSAAAAIFFNQGQMCSAGSRLLVADSMRDALLEQVCAIGRTLVPADPLDPATRFGAIVDEQQTRRVLDYVELGVREGATLALGGRRTRADSGGCYIEPTVFDGVAPAMLIAREEIFGPVLTVLPFRDLDEAIRIANGVDYGLAAAVWTRDLSNAHRLSRALRAGMVYVNCYDVDDITVPFGGYKQSGFGRDKSLHAFEKYTQLKTTWIDLSASSTSG